MIPFLGLFNYIASLLLFLLGLYAMCAIKNLARKVIGMVILQTGVILFYVSLAYKTGASIPILAHAHEKIDVTQFANPLPHALMLTAIVVGVSTLGVALVLLVSIHREHGSIEEDEILKRIEQAES